MEREWRGGGEGVEREWRRVGVSGNEEKLLLIHAVKVYDEEGTLSSE